MVLGEALFKIRFSSMSNKQFAAIDRQYAGLILPEESKQVFHVFGAIESNKFGANNCMPRKSIKVNLECSLDNPSRKHKPFNSRDGMCNITISANKEITLNDLVLCNQINGDISVKIKKR